MNRNSLLIAVVWLIASIFLLNACHPDPEPEPKPDPIDENIVPEGCIKDYDGNIYETVTIGDQTWMKDYLKTTHYADGTPIQCGEDSAENIMLPLYDYPSKIHHNKKIYGLLYNWTAATGGQYSIKNPSGVQGVCPDGWHMPSQKEWKQLFDYVSSHDEYVCGDDKEQIAKALVSKDYWNGYDEIGPKCSPTEDTSTNNITGLSLKPIGSNKSGVGFEVMVWTTNQNGRDNANYYCITCDVATIASHSISKGRLMGVRCVKD